MNIHTPPATLVTPSGAITTPFPTKILSAIRNTSQQNVGISTAFVALCHYNLPSLIPGNEGRDQMRRLGEMTLLELGIVSMRVTAGIRDCMYPYRDRDIIDFVSHVHLQD